MRHQRLLCAIRRESCLLLVCLAAILCLSHATSAQSGRNRKTATATPTPTPVADAPRTEPTEPSPEPEAGEKEILPVPAAALIISGNLVHDSDYYRSTDVSHAIKEVERNLKERPFINVIRGGKMTRAVAQETAKKETDTYVLWMELVLAHNCDFCGISLSYIDYLVFAPQTGKVFTYGRSIPVRKAVRVESGASIPLGSGSTSKTEQLIICGEDIAERVRSKLVTRPRP